MDNPYILLAIAVFFGIIGLVFGFVIGSVRRKKKDEQDLPELEPAPPPPAPIPVRNTPKDSIEILSVWRNERTGKLLALLETKPLSPSSVSNEQKDKLTQILAGLRTIIGEPTPPPPPAAPAKPLILTPIQPAKAPGPLLEQSETNSDVSAIVKNENTAEITPPPQAEKVYFADTLPEPVGLRQALSANPFKINVPGSSQKSSQAPKSIVEQIDEIFQAKLVDSPYAGQKILLREAPHGMNIFIGSYKYEGIDAVPDPAIRALIKESAREWNEKVSKRR